MSEAIKSSVSDLILFRNAKSPEGQPKLDVLCSALAETAAEYYRVEIKGPTDEFQQKTRVNLVDGRAVRVNRLHRKFTAQRMSDTLSSYLPSLLVPKMVTVSTTELDSNEKRGEHYISLNFKEEDAQVLIEERKKIWEKLAKTGSFNIEDIPWLDYEPEIKLVYFNLNANIPDPNDFASELDDIANNALPINVELAPAYPKVD